MKSRPWSFCLFCASLVNWADLMGRNLASWPECSGAEKSLWLQQFGGFTSRATCASCIGLIWDFFVSPPCDWKHISVSWLHQTLGSSCLENRQDLWKLLDTTKLPNGIWPPLLRTSVIFYWVSLYYHFHLKKVKRKVKIYIGKKTH